MTWFARATAAVVLAASIGTLQAQDFRFSDDPQTSALQHAVYDVVHRYEQLLNAGNTTEIVNLFAPDSVAEWNEKPTFVTRQEKIDAYNALSKSPSLQPCSAMLGSTCTTTWQLSEPSTTKAQRSWRVAKTLWI
jgi:hypothetical protein